MKSKYFLFVFFFILLLPIGYSKTVSSSLLAGINIVKTGYVSSTQYGYTITDFAIDLTTYFNPNQMTNNSVAYSVQLSKAYNYYIPLPQTQDSFQKPFQIANDGDCTLYCNYGKSDETQKLSTYGLNYLNKAATCTYTPSCDSARNQHTIKLSCPIVVNPDYYKDSFVRTNYNWKYFTTCVYNGVAYHNPLGDDCSVPRQLFCSNLTVTHTPYGDFTEGCSIDLYRTHFDYNPTDSSTWHLPSTILNTITSQAPSCPSSSPPSYNDQICNPEISTTLQIKTPDNCSAFGLGVHTNNTENPSSNTTSTTNGDGVSDQGSSANTASGQTYNLPKFGDNNEGTPNNGYDDAKLSQQAEVEQLRENWSRMYSIVLILLDIESKIYDFIVLLFYAIQFMILTFIFTTYVPGLFQQIEKVFRKATMLPGDEVDLQ